jgi:hypothetical protein
LKVRGRFKPEHEAAILESFAKHLSRRIRIKGIGEFGPEDGTLKRVVNIDSLEVVGPEGGSKGGAPLWERLARIGADTPEQAWKDVPSDLAENVDRYLHGRKRP